MLKLPGFYYRIVVAVFFVFAAVAVCPTNAQVVNVPTNNAKAAQVLLPNGWSLSPAGRSVQLGDLPLHIVLSHNKRLLAVTNNGQSRQSVQLIDPQTEKVLDDVTIGKSWYGLQFSADDKKLYVSGGNDNMIVVYPINKMKFGATDTFSLNKRWPVKWAHQALM